MVTRCIALFKKIQFDENYKILLLLNFDLKKYNRHLSSTPLNYFCKGKGQHTILLVSLGY